MTCNEQHNPTATTTGGPADGDDTGTPGHPVDHPAKGRADATIVTATAPSTAPPPTDDTDDGGSEPASGLTHTVIEAVSGR